MSAAKPPWNLKEKERSIPVKEMRSLILEGSVDHFLQPTRRTALYLWRILSSYEYVLDALAEVEEQKCQEVAAADNDPTKMSSQLLHKCREISEELGNNDEKGKDTTLQCDISWYDSSTVS
ncbi:hypothetical protein OIU85_025493 [Salix viminalis]|uniref:Uncharacterized protein n=1 Tax=Salix viminalis TaxID=40686 RepID=A0A9Q0TLN1_SALVM|nr:hypothetical protein OIU85_025493 [Salix viminalis]